MIAWCLGSIAITGVGLLFLPLFPGQRPRSFLQFLLFLCALAVLSLTISLAAHWIAGAWNGAFRPHRFEGLSKRRSFDRRVLEDGLQVFVFLLAQGAFGTVINGIVVAGLMLFR